MQSADEVLRERAEREGEAREHLDAAHTQAHEATTPEVAFDAKVLAHRIEEQTEAIDDIAAQQILAHAEELIAARHGGQLTMSDSDFADVVGVVRALTGKGALPLQHPESQRRWTELAVRNEIADEVIAALGPALRPSVLVHEYFDALSGEWVREELGGEVARYTPAELERRRTERAEEAAEGEFTTKGTVSVEDLRSWPRDKQLRFAQEYPREWEGFKQGYESVSGIRRSKKEGEGA
jgi:hypothetical protein